MAIVGDVFGLNSVYAKQVENVENSNFKSWPENAEHGYWAGGQKVSNSNYESEISRLDFSTETALTYPAILPVNAEQVASVTTNSYGYFGGGAQPTVRYNVISRLDFITETSSLPGNNLPVTKHLHAGTNTDTYGYFVGGYQNNVRACVITRLDFNTESISLPGNDVPGLKSAFTAVASNSYSYFGGGSIPATGPPGMTCVISRLDFSTETNSLPGKNLPSERYSAATIAGKYSGYFTGGESSGVINTVSRLDFDTETNHLPGNNLVNGKGRHSTVSNGQFGYIVSGIPSSNSEIQKFDFNNEVVSSTPVTVSAMEWSSGVQGGASLIRGTSHKSYGYTNSATSEIKFNKVDFATDGVSLSPGMTKLNQGFVRGTAFSDLHCGYYTAGISYPPGAFVSWTRRHDFSSETSSTPGDKCPYNARDLRSVSSKEYGYISGGQIPPVPAYYSFTARMDFSTTTFDAALNSGRNMSSNKAAHIGIQNSSYGYFGGGYKYTTETITYSTVDRLDFSTESYSLSANLTTPTSTGLMHGNGFQNGVYGYFGGGYTNPPKVDRCQIYRLDFSNETISSGGNLNSNFSRASAMSGLYDAWWMFGSPGLSGSRRSRYNYSTDTASALPDLTIGSGTAASIEFEN